MTRSSIRITRFGTRAILAAAVFAIGFTGIGPNLTPMGTKTAIAQDKDEKERQSQRRKTRRVKSLSAKTYKNITEVYEHLQEERYVEALARLQRIERVEKLPTYDQAIIQQSYGYIYAGTERYAEAASAFERMTRIGAEDLQPQVLTDALYYIAQLYISIEQFQKGMSYLNRWLKLAENPTPDAYILMAHAIVAQEPPNYRKAIPWVEKAMARAAQQEIQPKENWLQLLRGLYFETEQIPKAVDALELLVKLYPKKEYWMQLSAGYGILERELDQFTTLETAYRQDLFTKSAEYEELAQRYMFHGIPFRAAMVMQEGFDKKIIDRDKDNLELIANAYYSAQELNKAIPWYQRAAKTSDKANIFVLLGQIYMQREEWKKASTAFNSAIKKDRTAAKKRKISNPGNVQLMMGVAYFNQKKYKVARSAFRGARGYQKTRKDASQWLTHMEREIRRLQQSGQ